MRFMNLRYVKRYRMEVDLRRWQPPRIELPVDYRLVAWHSSLVQAHAEVKYQSFRGEIDSQVFPCLGELDGCLRLMSEIEAKDGFLPEATWLAEYISADLSGGENWQSSDEYGGSRSDCGWSRGGYGWSRGGYCGTIQAVRTQKNKASIQNIGVEPVHRGRGIGTAMILAALLGLHHLGIQRACLEVTAENEGAVRLYRELGFRTARTLYKAVELAYSESAR